MNTQANNPQQLIDLSQLRASSFNPRKQFADNDIAELAESIKAQGVLQPIMVRPQGEQYEIVYGERRYRAAIIAGLTTIPAMVKELSDTQAVEYALTENLQRKDVSPIEEATAYLTLIEQNRYTVAEITAKFGKSESYIRSRMKLNNLYQPFAELLSSEVITLAVALELCRYTDEVQQEIFDTHFHEGVSSYYDWKKKGSKDIIASISNGYSTDLHSYTFDKSDCQNCQFNSESRSLFGNEEGNGKCLNTACLKAKNIEHIVTFAVKSIESNPDLPLATARCSCDEAVEILKERGFDIVEHSYFCSCPQLPVEPEQGDYESEEEYAEAKAEYDDEIINYQADSADLCEKYRNGEITMYAVIGRTDVTLGYVVNQSRSNERQITPIEKLTKQGERFKEIEQEKVVADTKILVQSADLTTGEFSEFEERLTYYAMLSTLRFENFEKVGIDTTDKSKYHHLQGDEKLQVISNLTEQTKSIIRRDFILNTLKEAFRDDATSELLLEFAEQHAPEDLAKIQSTHREVYDKRHTRITEKIEAIEAQERASSEQSTVMKESLVEQTCIETNPFADDEEAV